MSKSVQPARAENNKRGRERSHLKGDWLKLYPQYGTIQATCVQMGISRETVYQWFKDPAFSEAFHQADKVLLEKFEKVAQYRAVTGVGELVLYKGKPVMDPTDPTGKAYLYRREYSDHCLEMLMRAKDPEKYGHRAASVEVKIDIRLIQQLTSEVINVIRRRVPDTCPHCKTLLNITPEIAKDMQQVCSKFETAL